jgi:hypothetical protein
MSMASERRKDLRVEWQSAATIRDAEGRQDRPCFVKDLSNGGAKITGVNPSEIPDRFMLRFARGARGLRACKVLWRNGDTLGVAFVNNAAVAGKPKLTRSATRQARA